MLQILDKSKTKQKTYTVIGFLVLPVVLTIICLLLTYFSPENIKFPSPKKIFEEIIVCLLNREVWIALEVTFLNLSRALIISLVLGIILGYLFGYNRYIWFITQPSVDFFRSIPVTFLIPAIALIIGSTSNHIICILAAYPCVLIIIFNVRNGITQQEQERIHIFELISGKKNFIQNFFKVTFYETLPYIFSGFRISISYAIVIITVLEYMSIGSAKGIGTVVNLELENQNYAKVYALLFIIGTIGFLINKITELIQTKYIHWTITDKN